MYPWQLPCLRTREKILKQNKKKRDQIKNNKLRNMTGWIIAVFLSGLLNAFLFGIMPGMIQKVGGNLDDLEDIKGIQVIRVKRPEPPARKKKRPKIVKQERKPLRARSKTEIYKQKTMKPKLDFELNPDLPTAPDTLVMPPLEHFDLSGPGLKGHFLASELDSPLTPFSKIPPIYPMRASRRGIEGWVTIQFIVSRSGYVKDIKIIKAKPEKIFNRSVIDCVSQWKFKPGTVEGVVVSTLAQTTIRFQLE